MNRRCLKSGVSCLRTAGSAALLFLVLAVIFSSGCVQTCVSCTQNNSTEVELPEDIRAALTVYSNNLKKLTVYLETEAADAAANLSDVSTTGEVIEALGPFSHNFWARAIIYADETRTVELPVPAGAGVAGQLPAITETAFLNQTSVFSPVYLPGEGYIMMMAVPVYHADGRYQGYVAIVYSFGQVLRDGSIFDAPDEINNLFSSWIIDPENNEIIYATRSEFVSMPPSFMAYNTSKPEGAMMYTRVTRTADGTQWQDMIAGWTTYVSHGETHVLFLERAVVQKPLDYTKKYTVDVEGVRDAVQAAYVDALKLGRDEFFTKVTAGAYGYDIAALDYEGVLLAAAKDAQHLVGNSYRNKIDPNGVAYIDQMIYTAGLGSGYVKYYIASDETEQPETGVFTVGYVISVPGQKWFIVGYSPLVSHADMINYDARSTAVSVSRGVVFAMLTNGSEETIAQLNGLVNVTGEEFSSAVTAPVGVIKVVDYRGEVYSNTYFAGQIGNSSLYVHDALNTSVTRNAIRIAKDGGGMMYSLDAFPGSENKLALTLYAVEPVDDTYFVMTGVLVDLIDNPVQQVSPAAGWAAG